MSFFKELKRRNVFRVGIAFTVAAWLLIQVTDIVFPRIGLPDSAVTLVIALLAIGLVPALILTWAFELTPDGIKKEAEVDRTKSITSITGRKLDHAIIGIFKDKNLPVPEIAATLGVEHIVEGSVRRSGEKVSITAQLIAEAVKGCFCGAPFDLDSAPNFKNQIEEAGFGWPPFSPIKYPAKDWC